MSLTIEEALLILTVWAATQAVNLIAALWYGRRWRHKVQARYEMWWRERD